MQLQQGFKLKNLISKSGIKISEILDKSKVAHSSLYGMFNKDEIERKKVMPILKVLGISYEDFIGVQKSGELEDLRAALAACQAEKDILKDRVMELQNELLTEVKGYKKNTVAVGVVR